MTKVVAAHLGVVASSSGQQLPVDYTFLNMSSVMFDAVLVPGGASSAQVLMRDPNALQFVHEAFRHCKAMCLIGESIELLRPLGVGEPDAALPAGVIVGKNDPTTRLQLAQDFISAIGKHRHWSRAAMEPAAAG
jgi:catalase